MSAELQSEAVELLQRLIRFDTVNPPGNERAAQEQLAGILTAAGLRCELLGRTPERPNLVARLDGAEPGPVLCLLSHVDTVLATASEWSHDPWSGELDDGFVWGRGALDMKSQTAAEVVAACSLARSGWRPPRGSLLVVVVVDEETGGAEGAQWLTATHPDKVRCDYLVNEGGGGIIDYGGRRLYCLGCAEKGVFRFALHTDGVAAHAAMPRARRQRAAQARPDPRALRAPPALLPADRRAARVPRGDRRARRRRRGGGARARARDRAAPGGAGRADARRVARADAGVRLREDQRDPLAGPPGGRLPRAGRASASPPPWRRSTRSSGPAPTGSSGPSR